MDSRGPFGVSKIRDALPFIGEGVFGSVKLSLDFCALCC